MSIENMDNETLYNDVSKDDTNSDQYTDISDKEKIVDASPEIEPEKEKMEEIYSTRDKHIRYKKQTPIEAEEEYKKRKSAKEGLVKGRVEIVLQDAVDIDDVELRPQLSEDIVVSDEIIDNVGEIKDIHSYVLKDVDDIDVDIEEDFDEKAYKRDSSVMLPSTKQVLPNISNAKKIVAEVPMYVPESKVQKIHIKAGRFTEVVESEYDSYLVSNRPTMPEREINKSNETGNKSLLFTLSQMATKYKNEQKIEEQKTVLNRDTGEIEIQKPSKISGAFSNIKRFFKVLLATIASTFVFNKSKKDNQSAKKNSIEDTGFIEYEDQQDAKYVSAQLKKNKHAICVKIGILSVILVLLIVLAILERVQGANIFSSFTTFGPFIYCLFNFILLIASGFVYGDDIIQGLKALRKIKGNVDSTIAIGFVGCLIQSIASLFVSSEFAGGEHHIYTILLVFAMILNFIGRLLIHVRTTNNFKFLTSRTPSYVAKVYDDEEIASRMISGTTASRPCVSYQHETSFMSDFLKISYAPDPSEEMSGWVAPVVVLSALFVGIVYFIISSNVVSAISSLTVMCIIGIPFASMLAGNIPLLLFSNKMLKYKAMVSGFPSVRQFCDTSAVMVKASDLYPKGSIRIVNIRPLVELGLEDILLSAGLVLKEVDSPMANVFSDIIEENEHSLPKVESASYEDKLGVVGWVNGVRVLIGNRALMNKYHVSVESQTIESRYQKEGKGVTFIASGGQLIAEVVTSYRPNKKIQKELFRAEENGICFLVSSNDPNITTSRIVNDFSLYKKTVKVMTAGYANEINDCLDNADETSRSYLATKGRFVSFLRAISGCVRLKSNTTMGLVIQVFGVILGILLCATMSLYAGATRLTVFNLFLYIIFWVVATIVAQLIKRP